MRGTYIATVNVVGSHTNPPSGLFPKDTANWLVQVIRCCHHIQNNKGSAERSALHQLHSVPALELFNDEILNKWVGIIM